MDKKRKFNLVDVIIVVLVLAVVFAGYRIVSDKEQSSTAGVSDVEFTVELKKCDKKLADAIKEGDDIYDSKKGGYYGKVVSVEAKPSSTIASNSENGNYIIDYYEDKYDIYVTIHGTPTSVTDGNIMFASQKVKVGLEMFLKSSSYVGIGYAVAVDFAE